MKKETEMKKDLKTFFKKGKGLRNDTVFMLHDGKLISANINDKETPGVYVTKFYADYDYINNAFRNNTIFVGSVANKLITGKGLSVSMEHDNLIIKSDEGTLFSNDISNTFVFMKNSKVEDIILHQYNKHPKLFKMVNSETINLDNKIDELLIKKKFVYEVPFKTINSYVIITNRMIKNFDKNTLSLSVSVTEPINDYIDYEQESNDDRAKSLVKIVKITVKDVVSKTDSYYAIIDK